MSLIQNFFGSLFFFFFFFCGCLEFLMGLLFAHYKNI